MTQCVAVGGRTVKIQFAPRDGVQPEPVTKACASMTIEQAANPSNYYLFDFKDESGEVIGHAEGVILIWGILDTSEAP